MSLSTSPTRPRATLFPYTTLFRSVRARDLVARLGRSGLGRYAVAAAWGGALSEVDLRCCCLVREALAAASPLADAVFGVQCLGAMPLHLAGTDEQRRRWLPGAAAGEVMAAF